MKITEGGTGSRHHAKAVGDADDHLPLFSLKGNTLDHEKNSHGLFLFDHLSFIGRISFNFSI